jgi:hypothetical protein
MRGLHGFAQALSAIIMLCCSATTTGQQWDEEHPHLDGSTFAVVMGSLSLSNEEQTAAQAAYETYSAAFNALTSQMRARRDGLANAKPVDWEQLHLDWWEARRRLEKQLESSVANTMVAEPSREGWFKALRDERVSREMRSLHDSQRRRQACDVAQLLDGLPLSPGERMAATESVDAYRDQIALKLRMLDDAKIANIRLRIDFNRDPEASGNDPVLRQQLVESAEKWLGVVQSIERLTAEYVMLVAERLEPGNRAAFLLSFDKATYPEAFKECPVDLAIEAIQLAPGIAADKADAVESLQATHSAECDELRSRILEAVRHWNDGGSATTLRALKEVHEQAERGELTTDERNARTDDLLRQHPARTLLERRHGLAIDTVKRMRAVFTEDEIEVMPLAARLCLRAW